MIVGRLLLALLCFPLLAQARPLAPLRPVSVVRTGVVTLSFSLPAAAWNGSEYLVVWQDARGVLRSGTEQRDFYHAQAMRISADCSVLQRITRPFATQCDGTGCTLPISTTRDRTFGLTLLRLDDDGTNVTASTRAVPYYAVPAPDFVEWPLAAGLLDAGERIAVLQQMATAAPHHGVHRLFLARFGTPKVRSVRR